MITEKNYSIKLNKKILILNKLAEYVGHTGIAGGQFLDLSYEKKKVSISKVIEMQKKKTGKLFEFCCLAPAIISGANNKTAKTIRKMLSGLEVMSYRAKGGKRNYEHESMMNEMMMERLGVATLKEVGTTMNEQENGVVDMEEEEEKVSVNVDDDERKED